MGTGSRSSHLPHPPCGHGFVIHALQHKMECINDMPSTQKGTYSRQVMVHYSRRGKMLPQEGECMHNVSRNYRQNNKKDQNNVSYTHSLASCTPSGKKITMVSFIGSFSNNNAQPGILHRDHSYTCVIAQIGAHRKPPQAP